MDSKEHSNCVALKKDLIVIRKSIEDYFNSKNLVGRVSKTDKQLAEAHSLLIKHLTYNGVLTRVVEDNNE